MRHRHFALPIYVALAATVVACTEQMNPTGAGSPMFDKNHSAGEPASIVPPPGSPVLSTSTISPTNDQNPYGVAFVPEGFAPGGPLNANDVLVSNFNNGSVQGTGSTVMQVKQSGAPASVFFQGSPGLGLTTALGVLKSGFVLVGSVPTTDGTCNTISRGALLIINRQGQLASSPLSDAKLLDGPWDLTVHETGNHAIVFVSNVLSGAVTRLNVKTGANGTLTVESMTQIASGYTTACNGAAVVVGPTGLAYDAIRDILYVASTADNAIFAISGAGAAAGDHGTGTLIYGGIKAGTNPAHLHGPLALALAPNGHLLTANGDAVFEDPAMIEINEIVEFTTAGVFVGEFQVDAGSAGAAFGLAVEPSNGKILFTAVDDNTAVLDEWREK